MQAPADDDDQVPTRESLLGRLSDWRDSDSWRQFFDSYWRLIYNTARKAGLSEAEAQDIVQETVISVANNIARFRYDPAVASFKTWMLNITRWRIINHLNRQTRDAVRHVHPGGDETAVPENVPDPAGMPLQAIWDAEWERSILNAALDKIKREVSGDQYQIFDLYCLENWPVEKVVKTLGVSPSQVYLAKHRIGRLLKKHIDTLQRGRY